MGAQTTGSALKASTYRDRPNVATILGAVELRDEEGDGTAVGGRAEGDAEVLQGDVEHYPEASGEGLVCGGAGVGVVQVDEEGVGGEAGAAEDVEIGMLGIQSFGC
jgi:hypothetical protein